MSDAGDARQPNVEELSFEQALEHLEKIVEQLESGKVGLDQALASYEMGVKLVYRCRQILRVAEQRIQKLTKGENGEVQFEEFGTELVKEEPDSGQPAAKRSRSRRGRGSSYSGEDHRRLIGDDDG